MKSQIQQLITQALEKIADEGVIPADQIPQPVIERARDSRHGDYACNVAMVLARVARCKPRGGFSSAGPVITVHHLLPMILW